MSEIIGSVNLLALSRSIKAAVQRSWLLLMDRTPSPAVLSSVFSTANYLQLVSQLCEAGDTGE